MSACADERAYCAADVALRGPLSWHLLPSFTLAMGRPKLLKNMTPEERAERRRKQKAAAQRALRKRRRAIRVKDPVRKKKLARRQQRRQRAKMGKPEKRARRQAEAALCYDWARLEPYIQRQADGHWLWRGPLRRLVTRVRPIVRAGVMGVALVDHVVCCLAHGRPPTIHCFPKKLCSEVLCISPDHLRWSNRVVERARRKQEGGPHVQEEG